MRAYKVTAPAKNNLDCLDCGAPSEKPTICYTGTGAESREARQIFVDTLSVRKKDVLIEEIEIPTSKADFIAWINTTVNGD